MDTFGAGRLTLRTRELVARGMTRSQLAWAVGAGRLIRVRIGHYCLPGLDVPTQRALRVGGRLACVSELARLGVWVTRPPRHPHVHVEPNVSRLRDPRGARVRLSETGGAVLHWELLTSTASNARVAPVDAFRQAMRCLPPLEAIASLDNGVRLGLVRVPDLRIGATRAEEQLLDLVDGRADSGLETHLRVPLVRARLRVEPQCRIPGIGDVDLLVERWVAVEADGERYHGAATSRRDRARDAALAAHAITPLRFGYGQILEDPRSVIRAIAGAVLSHRNVRFRTSPRPTSPARGFGSVFLNRAGSRGITTRALTGSPRRW